MTEPRRPPWHDDTPAFMPAELVDVMTYDEWQWRHDHEPDSLLSEVGEPGFTDEEALMFLRGASPTALTADAEPQTGAMIALVPDAATAERLVIPGGEPLGELHLTLCYLGEAAKIVPMQRSQLLEAARRLVQVTPIVDAEAFGVATWNPHKEQQTALVYNVGGGELEDVFEDVLGWVSRIMEDDLPEQYDPWSPHVCAAYSNDTGLLSVMSQKLGHVRFDRLRVAFAGVATDYPLYDGSDLTSGGNVESEESVEYADELNAAGKKESDVNLPGGNHNLKNYWTKGAGAAKIRWGTDGSFARCVTQLSKHVTRPQGLCAEYHKAATGEWPTQGGKHGIPSASDISVTLDLEPRLLTDFTLQADGQTVTEPDVEYDGGWEGILAVEDIETGDQRKFAAGSITWPDPKQVVVPLQWARENLGEHKGSVTVGRINEIWRDQSNPRVIRGRGTFDVNGDDGAEAFRQAKEGFLAGLSIDPDQVTDADVELIYPTTLEAEPDPLGNMLQKPELTVYHAGRIRGTTLVAFPAFIEGALQLTSNVTRGETVTASVSTGPWKAVQHEIALGDEIDGLVASAAFAFVRELDDVVDRQQCRFLHHEIMEDGSVGPANIIACGQHIDAINAGRTFGLEHDDLFTAYQHLAGHILDAGATPEAFALFAEHEAVTAATLAATPPREWFDAPMLSGPTPITVTDDGHIFGHAAVWGTCHTSFADSCVTPPREPDYSFFTTGEVMCADGSRVPVGQITLGTSHAPTRGMAVSKVVDHYGDTGTAVADVAAGVDAHGIWVSGAVRPGTRDEHVHALRASALSGDWRRIGGTLRMVALLAVNVPGFPIPRLTTTMQDTRQMAMVAAGVLDREQIEESSVNDFTAELEKLAGSCGIPLSPMKKKKTYDMGLDELVALVNGA